MKNQIIFTINMAHFYYEKYINNYEIDYWNDLSESERTLLSKKLNMGLSELGCFYKSGTEWSKRVSGMTFNLKYCDYYPKLKKHLDSEFKKFLRKQKLEQIDDRKRNSTA